MKLSSILIGGLVVSFGGVAFGNGSTNAIQMMQKGYYHSHTMQLKGKGTKPKASTEKVYQFQHKLDEPAPASTSKGRVGQTRLERAMLEHSLKSKPHLFSRWGKKVWGFFSLKKLRKIKIISDRWQRADASP